MVYYTRIFTPNHRETQQRGKRKQNHWIWGVETNRFEVIFKKFQKMSSEKCIHDPKNYLTYPQDIFEQPRIKWVDLHEVQPELVKFKQKHKDDPVANGLNVSYIWNAVRFANKVFCVTHAIKTSDGYDYVIWLDADTYTFRPMPTEFLENLLPTNKKEIFENRIEKICKSASKNQVPLFIDAEESWIQNTIDIVAVRMMQKFNIKEVWVFNTLQLYRNNRISYLEKLLRNARENNFLIGLKLVRGAYHEQEIERAKEKGYPCPVHTKKEKTDTDYNEALTLCIENIDIVSVCAGTHNEESSALLINLLNKHNIPKDDKRVYFSQLLGMSDHISYNAAKQGFNVVKYVPYGPVNEVIPYLIRRAEENTSITGQMSRELTNIIKEKKRRKNI